MGNTKQALQLITNELRDVDKAIEFCKEQDDSELWEDLINYSMDKPCKYQHKISKSAGPVGHFMLFKLKMTLPDQMPSCYLT